MALTIRLNDKEKEALEEIKNKMNCTTGSAAIKELISNHRKTATIIEKHLYENSFLKKLLENGRDIDLEIQRSKDITEKLKRTRIELLVKIDDILCPGQ